MDPFTILTSLLPFAIHAGKQVLNHYLGGKDGNPPPIGSMNDYLKYMDAKVSMFKALNNAGGNETTYEWVAAIKQLQRPFIAVIVFTGWIYVHLFSGNLMIPVSTVDNMAAVIGFYLFGDRTLFYSGRSKK